MRRLLERALPHPAAAGRRATLPNVGARRVTPLLAGTLAAALLLELPEVETAAAELSSDPWTGSSPATTALTGGVARLRAPVTTMIRVPRSTFPMGSTELEVIEAAALCRRDSPTLRRAVGERDESPCAESRFAIELHRHVVTLSSYWLDRVEVTVGAYRRCVELGRCAPLPYLDGARRFDRDELPAAFVRWEDAATYCRHRGARLPTEAEFERAARGPTGRRFPWGETFHRHAANHGRFGWDRTSIADGHAELAEVGSHPTGRTPDGFLDLAGNVAEWVNDRFSAPHAAALAVDPQGPPSALAPGATSLRVLKGGSYELPAALQRGAARQPSEGSVRSASIGFRCARSAPAHRSGGAR